MLESPLLPSLLISSLAQAGLDEDIQFNFYFMYLFYYPGASCPQFGHILF